MKIQRLTTKVSVISCPANVGIIECGENRVVLVDSALDDNQIKRAVEIMGEEGLAPVAVINTHAHSDHFGGNNYLKRELGVEVWAFEGEGELMSCPLNQPMLLFGGAAPPKILKNRLFLAKPSGVDHAVPYLPHTIEIGNAKIELMPLGGHTPFHGGVGCDGVLFCGDAFLSLRDLDNLGMPLIVDFAAQYETLNLLSNLSYRLFVTGHHAAMDDPKEAILALRQSMDRTLSSVMKSLEQGPLPLSALTGRVIEMLSIRCEGTVGYLMRNTTIYAAVNYLMEEKKISLTFQGSEPMVQIIG